jgi:hypothetical protein
MNVQSLQSTFKKFVSENAIFLDYIGLFESELEEITSVSVAGYDSSFDNNYVNGLRTLVKTNQKMQLKEGSQLGELTGLFGSYKFGSFYCCFIDGFTLLLILKPSFSNLAFLQEIVLDIRKKIKIK